MHKLVINIVERSLVVLVPLTLRLPGSETAAVVGIGLEWSQLGESRSSGIISGEKDLRSISAFMNIRSPYSSVNSAL